MLLLALHFIIIHTIIRFRCKKEEDEKTKLMNLIEELQKEKHQLNDLLETRKADMSNMNLVCLYTLVCIQSVLYAFFCFYLRI